MNHAASQAPSASPIDALVALLAAPIAKLVAEKLAETHGAPTSRPQPQMTVEDVSVFLKIPVGRVYDLVRKKAIPHTRVGKYLRFDPTALAAWLAKGGTAPTKTGKRS
jgi:excisionase family DNA binding protein